MNKLRKGIKVIYKSEKIDFVNAFGVEFEVWKKEGEFVKLSSLKEPIFGVVATVPCKLVTII